MISGGGFPISHFRRLMHGCCLLAAVAALGSDRAAAQTATPPATAAARLKLIAEQQPDVALPPVPPAPPAVSKNDPTAPGPEMLRLMGDDKSNTQGSTPSIPDIRLRARVIVQGKPPAALVEIGGAEVRRQSPSGGPPGAAAVRSSGVFRTIREGDELVVPQGDSTSPVRVVKLSASEVILEIVNRNVLLRLD